MEKSMFIDRIIDMLARDNFVCDAKSDKWYTYREIWCEAYRIAVRIKKDHSDGFVVMLENGIDLFVLYFAAMLSNKIIIPIDPHKAESEKQLIISENVGRKIIEDARDLRDSSIYLAEISDDTLINAIKTIDTKKDYMITYTSGSTGFPKGVRHNLENLFMAANSFGEAVGLDDRNTMCHVMPMSYMAGILNTILMPFLCGSKVILMPRFDVMSAVTFWRDVEKYDVNAFWLSPTMLNIIMTVDRKAVGKTYLSKIQPLFFIGTAPLYESIREKFERIYDVNLLQSYGLSETLFLSTEIPSKKSDTSAVGYVLPEVDISFDVDGQIKVRVPWMFLGYTNDTTDDYFTENAYKTGDLGIYEDGLLFIIGRLKDLIIKGGMNISPKQIEDCILRKCNIKECAIAGVTIDDEERIICWYVCEGGIDEPELNRLVASDLGKHYTIDKFEKVDAIPKNINGKIDKKRLVEEFRI